MFKKSLVKLVTLSTLSSLVLASAPLVSAQEEEGLYDWYSQETVWRTIQNSQDDQTGGFVEDESAKPTAEDLEQIMKFASLAPTSTGKQDFYMVAVTDTAEQETIIGDRYGKAVSDGTVTVLVYAERLLRDEFRTDVTEEDMNVDDFNFKFSPDRGYYNSGLVTGYLNVAATSYGYGTHMYMTLALPGDNGFNEGGLGQEASQYLEGADYYDAFLEESLSTENMKFVCAIVIGTPNEDALADTISGVTLKERPSNFHVYSGQEVEVDEEETEEVDQVDEEVTEEDTEEETSTEDAASSSENGLRGEAEGFNGPIIVELEMDGDTIVDIKIIEQDETPAIADKAFDELIPAIIENNGVDGVEVTSGASYTSQGIIDAVKNALEAL